MMIEKLNTSDIENFKKYFHIFGTISEDILTDNVSKYITLKYNVINNKILDLNSEITYKKIGNRVKIMNTVFDIEKSRILFIEIRSVYFRGYMLVIDEGKNIKQIIKIGNQNIEMNTNFRNSELLFSTMYSIIRTILIETSTEIGNIIDLYIQEYVKKEFKKNVDMFLNENNVK